MIESFRDEYSFLSNFTTLEKPLLYKGISYPTTEHFYQAMKFLSDDVRVRISKHPSKGLKALCRSIPVRDDWDVIKDKVMNTALKYKFSRYNPKLRDKLLQTGDKYIQEGNWWGDKYWGVCLKSGEGENNLGKILMEIRSDL